MPIHLPTPSYKPGGPDGKGWNRLSVGSLASDECALRPRDYTHLRESQDTRRARYGGYGPCIDSGDCNNCPIFNKAPHRLDAFDNRVLARIHPHDGHLYLMNRPEDGWASQGSRWTWEQVSRIDGWDIGPRHHDEHSDGFWLIKPTEEAAA